MTKMTFTLDEETAERLGRAADRLGTSKSEVLREAVRDYSERIGDLGEGNGRRGPAAPGEVGSRRHRSASERTRELLSNAALTVIVIAAMLLLGEVATRVLLADMTTTADATTWFARRWSDAVRFNELGFRDDFSPGPPAEGVYRIVTIGDSMTFGQGVSRAARYTEGLERRLNERLAELRDGVGPGGGEGDGNGRDDDVLDGPGNLPWRYEVANLGLPGTQTVDHTRILRDRALTLEPDWLLLQWFINDAEGHDKWDFPQMPAIPSEWRRNSALFSLINSLWVSAAERFTDGPSYGDYMLDRFRDPRGRSSLAAEAALRQFIRTCREAGLPLAILLFPEYYDPEARLDFLVDRMLRVCQLEDVPCVDLRQAFEGRRGDRDLWATWMDPHPSPLAHELVAQHIFERLGPVWLPR